MSAAPHTHSARRGGCTAAFAAGIEAHVVARCGNWKSEAIFNYVVDTVDDRLKVSNAIADSKLGPASFVYTHGRRAEL